MRVSRIKAPSVSPLMKNVVSEQNAKHSAIETGFVLKYMFEPQNYINRREAKGVWGNPLRRVWAAALTQPPPMCEASPDRRTSLFR